MMQRQYQALETLVCGLENDLASAGCQCVMAVGNASAEPAQVKCTAIANAVKAAAGELKTMKAAQAAKRTPPANPLGNVALSAMVPAAIEQTNPVALANSAKQLFASGAYSSYGDAFQAAQEKMVR